MAEEGVTFVAASRKEAIEMMNRGALLARDGKLDEAIVWMRNACQAMPANVRVLFNFAHVIVTRMQQSDSMPSLPQKPAPASNGKRANPRRPALRPAKQRARQAGGERQRVLAERQPVCAVAQEEVIKFCQSCLASVTPYRQTSTTKTNKSLLASTTHHEPEPLQARFTQDTGDAIRW